VPRMPEDVKILSQLRAGSGTPGELELRRFRGPRAPSRVGSDGVIGEAPMTTAEAAVLPGTGGTMTPSAPKQTGVFRRGRLLVDTSNRK
jgi:hypothetical protein